MLYHVSAVKKLWRKTARIFLEHPVLWLPFLCAHLLTYGLHRLQRFVDSRIIERYETWRSVLGGRVFGNSNPAAHAQAAHIVSILGSSAQYLYMCIGATALVVTAFLVAMIIRDERPGLKPAMTELRNYPKRILGYSFKYWFLGLVLTSLIVIPMVHFVIPLQGRHPAIVTLLTRVQVLITMALSAWIMTPIAIRLLRPPDSAPLTAVERRLGRYFAILAAIAVYALDALLIPLALKLLQPHSSGAQHVSMDLLGSVLSFPDLLASIALALLAAGGDWYADETPPLVNLRGLFRTLMPLHFHQGDLP